MVDDEVRDVEKNGCRMKRSLVDVFFPFGVFPFKKFCRFVGDGSVV